MKKIVYLKDGIEVKRPKCIYVDGCNIIPPSDEHLIKAGYEIKEVDIPESIPYVPTYEERVVQLIREKYLMDDELAILRQRDSKPDEFAEYNAYCEECKKRAKEEV